MRYFKIIVMVIFVILVATFSYGAASNDSKDKTAATPVISIDSAEQFIDQNVTLKSEVMNVRTIGARTIIGLEKRFSLAMDSTGVGSLSKAGIDVQTLPGKLIQVTGKVYMHPQFGIQMDLTSASQIVVGKDAHPETPKVVIPAADVSLHVDQYVIVEGTVVKASKAPRDGPYLLNFSDQPKGFTVAIFGGIAERFTKNNVDPLSFQGKKVQVTGRIIGSSGRFGPEIHLTKPENIKVVGESTVITTQSETKVPEKVTTQNEIKVAETKLNKGTLFTAIKFTDTELGKRWAKLLPEAEKLFLNITLTSEKDLHMTVVFIGGNWQIENLEALRKAIPAHFTETVHLNPEIGYIGQNNQVVCVLLKGIPDQVETQFILLKAKLNKAGLKGPDRYDGSFDAHVTFAQSRNVEQLKAFKEWITSQLDLSTMHLVLDPSMPIQFLLAGATRPTPGPAYITVDSFLANYDR